jgi:hypothetical protein
MYVADRDKQVAALNAQIAAKAKAADEATTQMWSERNRANSMVSGMQSLQAQNATLTQQLAALQSQMAAAVSSAASSAKSAILAALGVQSEAEITGVKDKVAWYAANQPGYSALVSKEKQEAQQLSNLNTDYSNLSILYDTAKKSLSAAGNLTATTSGGSVAASDYYGGGGSFFGGGGGGVSGDVLQTIQDQNAQQSEAADMANRQQQNKPSMIGRLFWLAVIGGAGYWVYKKVKKGG